MGPAVREVVRRRHAQRLLELPRPPRRRPATATRSRSTGRASRATRRAVTYQDLLDETCRVANAAARARRREGRPRRDLHGHGSRDRRHDARMRTHRRAALGRVRRLHRAVAEGPHQRRASESADHGRRRVATRQRREPQGHRRRRARRHTVDRARCSCCAAPRTSAQCSDGRDLWWHDAIVPASRRLRGREDGQRGPAVHPLHVGHHREAQGHHAHDRRLPHAGRVHAQVRVRPAPRHRRVLVHRRRRVGHRPLVHRLRPAREPGDAVLYEGTPDYPDKDRFWSIVEKYRSRSSTRRPLRSERS